MQRGNCQYLNTLDMTLLLPDYKVESIKALRSSLLGQTELTVRDLSQLIGKLTASIQAIFPHTFALPTPSKPETSGLTIAGSQGGNAMVVSAPRSMEPRPGNFGFFSRSHHRNRCFQVGMEGSMPGSKEGGLWSQMEKKLHINYLELLAGSFAVKSFTRDRFCVDVRL